MLLNDPTHSLLLLLRPVYREIKHILNTAGSLYHLNCQHSNFSLSHLASHISHVPSWPLQPFSFCQSWGYPISPTPPSSPCPAQEHNHLWQPAGGQFTGAALNPARVLGPAIVFHCYWNTTFVYVFGELFGGLLAAIIVLPLYGFGQFGSLLDTRVCNSLGIKIPEKHQHRCDLHSALQSHAVVLTGRPVLLHTSFVVWLDEQA